MLYKLKIVLLLFVSVVTAQETSLKVGKVLPGEIDYKAFELNADSEIKIKGKCTSFDDWEQYLQYYSWILDSSTREVVWRSTNCEDYSKEEGDYTVDKNLKLKAGLYEVYFASASNSDKMFSNGFGAIHTLLNSHRPNIKKFKKKYYIEIYGDKGTLIKKDANEIVDSLNKDNIVSIIRVGDSEDIREKFSLLDDTKVKIYGVGEGIRNEFYDFGYIYDVSKNKRVWTFNKYDGERAGGGKKNIVENAELSLPKGSYYVIYKTDDSHSFDEWNVRPPDDPQYWGIIVSLKDKSEQKNIIPFNEKDISKPVIEITKVEDEELISKGMKLKRNMELRVLSIGEGYSNLVDYGWIENADTKEIVWQMTPKKSIHAGGARKNRMEDDIINLSAGNYIVHYVTDDSHNYDDWNDTPPYDEEKWGITVWTTDKNDSKYVENFDAENYKSKYLITSITEVGDDENLVKPFVLKKKTKIKIIAIGERGGSKLVDYAWITDKYGNVVWEMESKETMHAGGASKNRLFSGTILLKAGKYKLHYQTDDSHSFEEWNSTPPDNIKMYGVTLLKIK